MNGIHRITLDAVKVAGAIKRVAWDTTPNAKKGKPGMDEAKMNDHAGL